MVATLDGINSLLSAMQGDFSRLEERLRDPSVQLDAAERQFLADNLGKELELDARKEKRSAEDDFEGARTIAIYEWHCTIDGKSKTEAKRLAGQHQKEWLGTGSKNTVDNWLGRELHSGARGFLTVARAFIQGVAKGDIREDVAKEIIFPKQ